MRIGAVEKVPLDRIIAFVSNSLWIHSFFMDCHYELPTAYEMYSGAPLSHSILK